MSEQRASTEQINKWANRARENLHGGWYGLADHQLGLIIEATGGPDEWPGAARPTAPGEGEAER